MSTRKQAYYAGVRMAPYDIVREVMLLLGGIAVLVVILSAFLSSPDIPPLTLKSVAVQTPQIFSQTALSMLNDTSPISTYGPPYNNGSGSVQSLGPISMQRAIGVHIPINTAQDFVIRPLTEASANDPALATAINTFESASASQQASWENSYNTALTKATASGSKLGVPACSCGPVAEMMSAELKLGQSGAMDGLLLTSGHFYQTDFTRPLLFMQNAAVQNKAQQLNLLGNPTWGVMNETGNYPGQEWLWLYTLFYQIPPYTNTDGPWAWAPNIDLLAVLSVTVMTFALMFIPWIPGLRSLPKLFRVYRLIWRDYYREQAQPSKAAS